jgi:hypothetical protein
MEYFAGIFDADGHVSLIKSGHFVIGLEKSTPDIPELLLKNFGGKIYRPRSKSGKSRYYWMIATNREKALNFINNIEPHSRVKGLQLFELRKYLESSKENRKIHRDIIIKNIARAKIPTTWTKEKLEAIAATTKPDPYFYRWLAGFMDGDGNFTVFEYDNHKKRSFDSWIGAFNTHADAIINIIMRIPGSISSYKGNKFPICKWVCSQKASLDLCQQLLPHLILRKEQCRLVMEYLEIHSTKQRGIDYSEEVVVRIREIIRQIKHLHSL